MRGEKKFFVTWKPKEIVSRLKANNQVLRGAQHDKQHSSVD
jgi:hypothetical protein